MHQGVSDRDDDDDDDDGDGGGGGRGGGGGCATREEKIDKDELVRSGTLIS